MFKKFIPKKKMTWVVITIIVYSLVVYKGNNSKNEKNPKDSIIITSNNPAAKFLESPAKTIIEKMQQSPKGKALVDAWIGSAIEEKYGSKNIEDIAAKESSEVLTLDLVKGDGETAYCGNEVTINSESFMDNKIQFDSTYKNNTPNTFTIGEGKVLPGLEDGIIGMKVNGKRRLIIPPKLAYGNPNFKSNFIPKDKAITIEVKLMAVKDGIKTHNDAYQTQDIIEGTTKIVRCGDKVKITYFLTYPQDGKQVTTESKEVSFKLGAGNVPIGLEQGIIGTKLNGMRAIAITPELQKTPHPLSPPIIGYENILNKGQIVSMQIKLLSID